MRYIDANWEVVGEQCTAGLSMYSSLWIHNGTPYVAYVSTVHKGTVMKFSGYYWENEGDAEFSEVSGPYVSLFINNGVPYIAYIDNTHDSKATVKKYKDNIKLSELNPINIKKIVISLIVRAKA